jgi:hypothetical protein
MRSNCSIHVVKNQKWRFDKLFQSTLYRRFTLHGTQPPQMAEQIPRLLSDRIVGRIEPLGKVGAQSRLARACFPYEPEPL